MVNKIVFKNHWIFNNNNNTQRMCVFIVRCENNEFEICDSCDVDNKGSLTSMATIIKAIVNQTNGSKDSKWKVLNAKRCMISE